MVKTTKSKLICDINRSTDLPGRFIFALLTLLSPGDAFVTFLMAIRKSCEDENVDLMEMLNSID